MSDYLTRLIAMAGSALGDETGAVPESPVTVRLRPRLPSRFEAEDVRSDPSAIEEVETEFTAPADAGLGPDRPASPRFLAQVPVVPPRPPVPPAETKESAPPREQSTATKKPAAAAPPIASPAATPASPPGIAPRRRELTTPVPPAEPAAERPRSVSTMAASPQPVVHPTVRPAPTVADGGEKAPARPVSQVRNRENGGTRLAMKGEETAVPATPIVARVERRREASAPLLNRETWETAITRQSEPPMIRVSIGRVEVRATPPPPVPAAPVPDPPRPAMSLDDYLTRRADGAY